MAKKQEGFNSPFKGLKLNAPEAPSAQKRAAPAPSQKTRPAAPNEDDALFLDAMSGVAPLTQRPSETRREVPLPRPVDDEAESLAELAELVVGQGELDLVGTQTHLEGGAPGLDKRVLKALRRGEYPLQARLDLHGLNRVEAKTAVEQFIVGSRREGKRCVLLIHGKGLSSQDQVPVIKEQLRGWLNQGKIAKSVLAFASARPQDGGTGALYVLLRK
ncbi:MAG: Smr/MutS family protein [Myxococcaceae bacterium]